MQHLANLAWDRTIRSQPVQREILSFRRQLGQNQARQLVRGKGPLRNAFPMYSHRWLIRPKLFTLMILIACFAMGLGWLAHAARRQRLAVAAIKGYGGYVLYDWEFVDGVWTAGKSPKAPRWLRNLIGDEYFQDVYEVNILFFDKENGDRVYSEHLSDDVADQIKLLPNIKKLHMMKGQATDRAMDVIGQIKGLRLLSLMDATVTDAGLAKPEHLSDIEYLALYDDAITERGLSVLEFMPKLKELELRCSRISDGILPRIVKLSDLESLVIDTCDISDDGFMQLAKLNHLKSLFVVSDDITLDAVKRFRAMRPHVKVIGY